MKKNKPYSEFLDKHLINIEPDNTQDKQVSSHTPELNLEMTLKELDYMVKQDQKHRDLYEAAKAENEKLKADKAVLLEALKKQKQIIEYIARNASKINENTFAVYTQQIINHTEDSDFYYESAIKQINK